MREWENVGWLSIEILSSYLVQEKWEAAAGEISRLHSIAAKADNDTDLKSFAAWYTSRMLDHHGCHTRARHSVVRGLRYLQASSSEKDLGAVLTAIYQLPKGQEIEQKGEEAVEYVRLAEIATRLDCHVRAWCELICTLADILVHEERIYSAQYLYEARIELSKKHGFADSDLVPWGHARLGRLYLRRYTREKDTDLLIKAEEEFKRALSLAGSGGDSVTRMHAFYGLAKTNKARGSFSRALYWAAKSLLLCR
jgi:tetratricopeptide (TPR) repeat protein